MIAYLSLFVSALGAATLLPLQSEAVFVGLLLSERYQPAWLLAAAASGNVLGACINWYLGTRIECYKDRKWFPVPAGKLLKAQNWYTKYGSPLLLLSWMPVIGDPITLVSGVLREKFVRFLVWVTAAKLGRYLFLYFVFSFYR